MKLVQALNGDYVNITQASSFNVADFGNRAVVFARVGNTSYELFQSFASQEYYFKAAESYLENLFNKLGEVLNTPANEIKSIFLEPQYTWTIELDGEILRKNIKDVMETKPAPKKRTPRKKVTGNE